MTNKGLCKVCKHQTALHKVYASGFASDSKPVAVVCAGNPGCVCEHGSKKDKAYLMFWAGIGPKP